MLAATLAIFLALTPSLTERVDYVVSQLLQNGFSRQEAQALFHNRHLRPYPARQVAPHQIDWEKFIAALQTSSSLHRGQQFLARHQRVLSDAEERFGVDKESLAALARVETNFGKNTGRYVTFNVFYTSLIRSADESRWKMAAENLVSLAVFCKRWHKDCFRIKGSYAGAIGITQFLPHTLELYGYDGDGDGVVNAFVFSDAIFSTANFLVQHGWQQDPTAALGKYYGNPEGYPRAVLAYADSLRKMTANGH